MMCQTEAGEIRGEYELIETSQGYKAQCRDCGQFLTTEGTSKLLKETKDHREFRVGE